MLKLHLIKAHTLVLAKKSPWFHRFFQSLENTTCYNVSFFGYTENLVQAVIDVIYEKEILFPSKDKGRLTSILTKLGVSWSDENIPEEMTKEASHSISLKPKDNEKEAARKDEQTCPMGEESPPNSPTVRQAPLPIKSDFKANKNVTMQLPVQSKSDLTAKTTVKETCNENDFHEILDQFTETNDEELKKISHMLIGEAGKPDRNYKCLKCPKSFKYFSQAQKHHKEHEFNQFSSVRETLKKAELERQNDDQNISKIEKGIGKTDKKKLISALRRINENLHKHLENLDSLEKSKLPQNLSKKCKEYSRSLIETTAKADKVLNKLGI